MVKVALVTNMIPPYRVGFYEELAKHVQLTVIADRLSEVDRKWEVDVTSVAFDVVISRGKSFVYTRSRNDVGYHSQRSFHFSEKTLSCLNKINPDVVCSIEFGLKTTWSALYAHWKKIPLIMLSEGTLHTEGHVGSVKSIYRKILVKFVDRFWSNGRESTALLESYGVDSFSCDEGMTGVDTLKWLKNVEEYKQNGSTAELKKRLGLVGKVFVFSANISEGKGVRQMVRALEQLNAENHSFSLLVLGDGDLREELEACAKKMKNVVIKSVGFLQLEELLLHMACGDWGVLPTLDDNWPLAGLEILVAGLPQLHSVYNGGSYELCEEGVTGYLFDPLNTEDFVSVWKKALLWEKGFIAKDVRLKFVEYYSPKKQAERAYQSILKVLT